MRSVKSGMLRSSSTLGAGTGAFYAAPARRCQVRAPSPPSRWAMSASAACALDS